ncbi:MAG: hypothetical protein M3Q13_04960 [Pseudomonadota bacterium]|nr:hypothetical protein [Pseudomonadota bacterium]
MSDDPKRPWYTQLPAKLAAVVVFLVAITTLLGNVMELIDKRRAAAAPAPVAASQPTTNASMEDPAARAPQSDKLRLQLERIAVETDGSLRTTDWRFSVEADGEPLFVVQQDEMDDTVGRNVVLPEDAATVMRLPEGKRAALTVKGWRGSRLRMPGTAPDVTGEGLVASAGALTPIRVRAVGDEAGAFVFYFSATRE